MQLRGVASGAAARADPQEGLAAHVEQTLRAVVKADAVAPVAWVIAGQSALLAAGDTEEQAGRMWLCSQRGTPKNKRAGCGYGQSSTTRRKERDEAQKLE
eukprot:306366-Chlamydomonas_euryale.AAC.2